MRRLIIMLGAIVAVTTAAVVLISTVLGGIVQQLSAERPTEVQDVDLGAVQQYDVLPDATLQQAAPRDAALAWQTFVRMTTPGFAGETVVRFETGDAPDSDTSAYVYRLRNPTQWALAVNLAADGRGELIATLVHEYAHLLSLSTEQFDPKAADCPTLELSEGCARDDATLLEFQRRFWSAYTDAPEPESTDDVAAFSFFQRNKEDFVSSYAATNVVEDYAESFMTFVLEDEPATDSPVAAKLALFWEYPELVAIRERVRAEFATELGLPA